VRELPDDGACLRIDQEEPHEAETVVSPVAVGRKEDTTRVRRKGRDEPVADEQSPTLGDRDPLVDVGPGILATDDDLADRESQRDPKCDEREWQDQASVRPRRRAAIEQPPAPRCQGRSRHPGIGYEQPVQRVAGGGGHREYRNR
jgi:hypothetical protein